MSSAFGILKRMFVETLGDWRMEWKLSAVVTTMRQAQTLTTPSTDEGSKQWRWANSSESPHRPELKMEMTSAKFAEGRKGLCWNPFFLRHLVAGWQSWAMEAVPLPTCWLIRVVVFECACNGFAKWSSYHLFRIWSGSVNCMTNQLLSSFIIASCLASTKGWVRWARFWSASQWLLWVSTTWSC